MKLTATKVVLELELSEAKALRNILGALTVNDYENMLGKNNDEIDINRRIFKELSDFFGNVL